MKEVTLTIYQGRSYASYFTVKLDGINLSDLTGYSFRSQIKRVPDALGVVASFDLALRDQITDLGYVDMILPKEALTNLVIKESDKFKFDVVASFPDEKDITIIKGNIIIVPRITK